MFPGSPACAIDLVVDRSTIPHYFSVLYTTPSIQLLSLIGLVMRSAHNKHHRPI